MLLEKIKLKINITENKKNVARISLGTMGGQAISFITLPILTRIYGASIIGTWTLFNSMAIIINSFSDLGLSNAIMLEKEEDKMIQVYKVITTLVLFFSVIGSIFTFIYYNNKDTNSILNKYFVCIFMFISIFTLQQIQVCYTWLNRKSEYKILMKNPLINNLAFGIVAITLGLCGVKNYGYFLGWIFGQLLTLIHMKKYLPKCIVTFNIADYRQILEKYIKFVKFQLPTNILINIKNQIPVIFIRIFFGETILGYYSVVVRIMQIPISLLASAMGRVFFQTVSDMKRKGEAIGEYVYNNIKNVTKIASIPLIVIIAVGDYMAVIFLGEEWKVAGHYMRILVFQNYFMFLMSTVQGIAITLDKQKLAMVFSVIQSIGFISGLSCGKLIFNNPYIGIILMSFVFVICNIIYFCLLFEAMNVSHKKYLVSVLNSVVCMTVFAVIIRLIILSFLNYLNISI